MRRIMLSIKKEGRKRVYRLTQLQNKPRSPVLMLSLLFSAISNSRTGVQAALDMAIGERAQVVFKQARIVGGAG